MCVLADGDVTHEFKSERMREMAGWLADLLQCYQKDVSNAASWQIAQLILTRCDPVTDPLCICICPMM